jgi:cobalt-zinc-cadmium efflux system protein
VEGRSQDWRLALVLAINLAMVAGLLTVGLVAHSLGVLASAADYLGDALGAGLSLTALRLSRREHGHARATTRAALVNSSFLLIVTLAVGAEAIRRLIAGAPSIHGAPVVVISVLAAAAMIGCAFILGDVEGDLSMESVMLDTVADAAAAIGVAISGVIILATDGSYWLDSLVALLIAIVVAYHALRLMRRAQIELSDKLSSHMEKSARPEASRQPAPRRGQGLD